MGGLQGGVKSVRMLTTGRPVAFEQDELALRLRITLYPTDDPVTVLAVECVTEPVMDHLKVRENRPRYTVGARLESSFRFIDQHE